MIKVVLFGSGNVASHLSNEFLKSNSIELVQVYNRTLENIKHLKHKTSITNQISDLKEADVYIISISDDDITDFSKQLNLKNKLVVHTSGALDLSALKSQSNKGVFYPLQTFTKNKELDFSTIPFCIEAENKNDLLLLEKLAKLISEKCFIIDSDQRKALHVSAVFVNNFVNHLYHLGNEICTDQNVPFEILLPLIKETAAKIENLTPFNAQTGPARRNDHKTMQKHLELLNNNQENIYKLISNSILNTYGKKL